GFSHPYAGCFMRARLDNATVQGVDKIRYFRRGTGCDFDDVDQAPLLIPWIDALRAVSGEEVLVEDQPRDLLQNRHANLFGRAGVDSGLVNNDIIGLEYTADSFAGSLQGRQIRSLSLINRCGHGDD